jgi:uncharacterized membrane protein HdeD (DUF308 family)
MSTTSVGFHPFEERVKSATRWLTWAGVGMTVLGVAALVFPMVSTLAITLFVGSLFLVFGIMSLAVSFSIRGAGPFFGALLYSLAAIGAGVFTLFNPAAGALALTLMVGVLFMLQGAYEAVFAFEMRPASGWGAMLFSAAASIILAIVIFARWPAISTIVLGVLFGVNFISSGIGLIIVSRAVKP